MKGLTGWLSVSSETVTSDHLPIMMTRDGTTWQEVCGCLAHGLDCFVCSEVHEYTFNILEVLYSRSVKQNELIFQKSEFWQED